MMLFTIWFVADALSVLVVLADEARHPNRMMPIMNWVWPLVALYFGPFGGLLYILISGRGGGSRHVHATPALPHAGTSPHETAAEIAPPLTTPVMPSATMHAHHGSMSGMDDPLWIRSARSSTHCMAGCALGDLIAMLAVEGFGLRILGPGTTSEVVLGAVLAFLFGLFVFQALPVMAERHIGFRAAFATALRADMWTVTAYLIGQVPTFYWLSGWAGAGAVITVTLLVMQASMAVGFLTTYPMNYWLVARGVKQGM